MICFLGFYPALSQQFYLSDNPLYHVGAGFSFDSISLALSPLDFPFWSISIEKVSENHRETRSLLSDINSKLAENIEGIRIIQAFNQEKRLQAEFDEINQEHLVYANRSVALDALF